MAGRHGKGFKEPAIDAEGDAPEGCSGGRLNEARGPGDGD